MLAGVCGGLVAGWGFGVYEVEAVEGLASGFGFKGFRGPGVLELGFGLGFGVSAACFVRRFDRPLQGIEFSLLVWAFGDLELSDLCPAFLYSCMSATARNPKPSPSSPPICKAANPKPSNNTKTHSLKPKP